ncbi:MAG: homocysteine S-methyltransferase family protein [Clostridiaceae bacterium]|nr:homocysteine S-methyltransferase family protein [Clostridiaceae bacterium]
MKFIERLGKEWLFFDGGMGSILQERGLAAGELPETWNITHPEEIQSIHRAYLDAGSDIINTNTFGANALKFPDNLREIVEAAVSNAKEARRQSGREDAYIALDLGPTGRLLQPMGDLPFEQAVELFGEVVRIGAAAGVDLVLIETMSDSYELKAAVLAAKENCVLPVLATVIFDENGKMLTGGTVDSAVAMLEGLRVDALGVNCGLGPKQMLPIVKRLTEVSSLPVIVNPNAGLPRSENGKTVYDIDADEFAALMGEIADLGVQVLGGCCGTTPAHIRKMIETCKGHYFVPVEPKHRTVVSSFSQAVEIGQKPVIIGERINPTGKSKFKAALRENNIEYILSEGLAQEDNGAHILDVNVGMPEIDEPAMMERVVTRLQGVTALPLQIDTSDTAAMERGMRLYNGKPMINSVSGKRESMEAVFPLVKKYGGVVVGLTLDENGIPDSAEGRVQIAKKIYDTAVQYGIGKEDIVIDGLAMTISSDSRSALVTLETLRRVRDELGGHTILGVSNISFGLPQREIINANFFTMALQNGLSCAIINPNADAMMRAYRAFLALTDQDAQCAGYIAAYGNQPTVAPQAAADSAIPLGESIERGLQERAAQAAKAALQTVPPLELVNTELIPALDRVGKGFEAGTVFLPQLLMSAEAAKAAFEVVKDAMRGAPQATRGKIILATVKGDIHDIGKNIVKVLLENYGYQVLDLGKDVAPEVIVDTAIQEEVALIGLSALMTTTVVSMEQTIRLLREKKPDTKVVVGGAVLTQEYADSIGADCYARDAMATVHYADSVFG